MGSDDVTQEEYESLASFRHTIRKFLRFSEQAAREVGLTPRRHQALLAIRGRPTGEQTTVGDLARLLVSKPHTVSELLDRLEGQNLVTREPSQEDARQVVVRLTKEGHEVLARLTSAHRDEVQRLKPVLLHLLDRFRG